jgi:DNA primase
MTLTDRRRFDVSAVRRDHPIEGVIAASGVELTQRGQGFMGCCPFHDDSTASLSVGGVPDRFHCFGCGAGGDVIEYVPAGGVQLPAIGSQLPLTGLFRTGSDGWN